MEALIPFIPYLMIPIMVIVYLSTVPIMIQVERKVSAWLQYRMGPNRVGPLGLLQPIADALKMLSKEDVIPNHVNKWLYIAAPALMVFPAFFVAGVIPLGVLTIAGQDVMLQIGHTNIGILYVLAISSIAVYSIAFGAWASNNKYSLLGGMRSAAQMMSYELPMGLSILGMIMLTGSLRLEEIVNFQMNSVWGIVWQPLGFLIFFTTAYAETNRLPFDLTEAEAELVAGYHTEYSSLKFGMYYLGEYCNMLTASFMVTILFLGGWHVPFLGSLNVDPFVKQLIQVGAMAFKVAFLMFTYVWVRWTLPRFRYDQLMNLGWKKLIPLALANVVITAVVMAF
ncbi:MAG: NADH-quinone oxidoreductase subunit NuoH [Bacteroidetes bacterium]|nr:NADH-quinone oxidoreductase subunit NuoH [Bacteroidota bacterium]